VGFRNRARLEAVDRIAEAQEGCTLTEAALEAGFGSYAQFFRVFRALRGVAPHAYYRDDREDFHG
jgi:AraC-like DNA-binding protein